MPQNAIQFDAPDSNVVNGGVTSYNGVTGLATANANAWPQALQGNTEFYVSVGANGSGATGTAPLARVSIVPASKNSGNASVGAPLYLAGGATGIDIYPNDAGRVKTFSVLAADNNGYPAYALARIVGYTGPVSIAVIAEGETFA